MAEPVSVTQALLAAWPLPEPDPSKYERGRCCWWGAARVCQAP
jgi:hypothetical protein